MATYRDYCAHYLRYKTKLRRMANRFQCYDCVAFRPTDCGASDCPNATCLHTVNQYHTLINKSYFININKQYCVAHVELCGGCHKKYLCTNDNIPQLTNYRCYICAINIYNNIYIICAAAGIPLATRKSIFDLLTIINYFL